MPIPMQRLYYSSPLELNRLDGVCKGMGTQAAEHRLVEVWVTATKQIVVYVGQVLLSLAAIQRGRPSH